MSEHLGEFRDQERIRLVEADLAQTNEFVKGVVATGTAVRGIAVTIWLALMGVALQQSTPSLGALGIGVAVVFWLIDGYYGWLYTEASVHARACEKVLSEYFNAISRGDDDPGSIAQLHTTLRAYSFGLYLGFRSDYGWKQWWNARPRLLYRTLYPVLIAVSLVVSVLFWTGVFDSRDDGHRPERESHHHGGPRNPGPFRDR